MSRVDGMNESGEVTGNRMPEIRQRVRSGDGGGDDDDDDDDPNVDWRGKKKRVKCKRALFG